jgi:eukaryotic-like serine/threonine-protein kinase
MTSTPSLPDIIASRYMPVRLIAQGGMGAVYEVEHVRTGEHLALKVMLSGVGASTEALGRFKREARASARIKSDHVVRVIDADVAPELDGAPFLVMELLEGSDLERKAGAEQPVPGAVVGWLRQVGVAIDKAHRLGIIHRDLKPQNLFLTSREDGTPMVKVLDFGIVKMTEDGTGATGSGQILGTPQYMAPEQVSATAQITPAVDRYALGLVAYRLLTGESYYAGDVMNILAQLLHEPLRLPSERHPDLGTAFDAWFARACHRSPGERFTSASEQVEALAVALGLPSLATETSSGARAAGLTGPTTRRRSRVAIALGVVAALAAGSIAVMVIARRLDDRGSGEVLSAKAAAAATPTAASAAPAETPPAPGLAERPGTRPIPTEPTVAAVQATATPIGKPSPGESRRGSARTRRGGSQVVAARPTTPAEPVAPTGKEPAPDPYADQK